MRKTVGLLLVVFLVLHFNHHVVLRSDCFTLDAVPSNEQPYRTAFHFQPPRNWMNDPNGPMYYNGVYHLFYQHNPFGPLFSNQIYWAHSVSHDLINWTPLDLAIAPTEPFDINSCWSGSATILPGNKPVILYTGIDSENRQVQNLAIPKNSSDPYLREWVKYTGNPIINLPEGIKNDDFRDPTTAWLADDGKWRIIVGSQKDKTGIAFLYQSIDFVNWSRYDSPLHQVAGTGIWECPDFFPVWVDSTKGADTSVMNTRVKHVLKVGLWDYSVDYYMIGNYSPAKENYIPQNELTLSTLRYDYGKYYASKSFFDPVKKRRILMAWVNESDSEADDIAKGWSGLHSFPRSLWLDQNQKQLVQWPIEEMASAYCQAGHDLTKASEILYSMLGSSSTSAPVLSVGENGDGDAKSGNKPSKGLSRSKPRNSGVSAGSISGIIGADYGKLRGASKKACTTSKPVKLMSNEIPASQIWDEKPHPVHATKESMNKDVELFLLTMLGDGFQLDLEVIREVLGGCGYDVQESMEKLMNLASPTLDTEDVSPSLARAMSVKTYEDLGSEFEHKLQFSDSSGSERSNIEKELLNNLFTVPERSHGWPSTTSIREPRTRRYIVTGPLEDGVIQFMTPIVKKEVNGPGNEEIEDDYETLREAAREHWVTMKKYYRAAADAYAKGNYVVADKLVKEGHFYMAKAREANETSGKMLTQARFLLV